MYLNFLKFNRGFAILGTLNYFKYNLSSDGFTLKFNRMSNQF